MCLLCIAEKVHKIDAKCTKFHWLLIGRRGTRLGHPFLHFGFPFVFLHDICIVQSKQPMLAHLLVIYWRDTSHTHSQTHIQQWPLFTWHFSHIKWHRQTMNLNRSLCKQLKCHHCNDFHQHIQIPLPHSCLISFQHITKNEEEETTHQWTLFKTACESCKWKIKIQKILLVSKRILLEVLLLLFDCKNFLSSFVICIL